MKKLFAIITIQLLLLVLIGCGKKTESGEELMKNLVAHYSFNENSGEKTKNLVTNVEQHVNFVFNEKNQLSLFKPASDPLWRKNGISGGALLFDGYSTYIQDRDFVTPEGDLTISLWVAPRAFEWGAEQKLSAFISQGSTTSGEGFIFGMYRHGTWAIQLGLGSGSTKRMYSVWAPKSEALKVDEWAYLTATYKSETGEVRLYKNGELVKMQTLSVGKGEGINPSNIPLQIGRHSTPADVASIFKLNTFAGLMDEVKIYNEVISETDIKAAYQKDTNGRHPVVNYDDIKLDPSIYDGDRYRPQFHAIPPGMWMNEPHAPIYYNGKYHLFYQHNPFGPFWHQIHWGHWVSDDMITWENLPIAIPPQEPVTPDGVWSGSASYDEAGNPILFITAGNDSMRPNQMVAICRPTDLSDPNLTNWNCDDKPIVTQNGVGSYGDFRDPFVWKEGNTWYMVVGGGQVDGKAGAAHFYSSTNLKNWNYHGDFLPTDMSLHGKYAGKTGVHWELPVYLPLRDEQGSETGKGIFMILPHPPHESQVDVFYWIGQFDKNLMRFVPDQVEPQIMDYGYQVFTGPSGFVDPKTGRSIVFTIHQDREKTSREAYFSGWTHTTGMPVSLWLDSKTQTLRFEPVSELANARQEKLVQITNKTLNEANQLLRDVKGDLLEIILEVDYKDASKFGIDVRKSEFETTQLFYNTSEKTLTFDSTKSSVVKEGVVRVAPLDTSGDTVKLHIVLDRSMVEIYANQVVSISQRISPTYKASMGVELFSEGNITIVNMEVYRMGSVYSNTVVEPYFRK